MPQKTSRDRVGRLIQHVARNWRRAVNQSMAPLGLTEATWLPLLILDHAGSLRQGELADELGLDRSSVVRLIDTLSDQGLLRRQDDPGDRRAKRLFLTPAAEPVVKAARAAAMEVQAQALAGLDAAALDGFEAVLSMILAQLPGDDRPAVEKPAQERGLPA